MVFYLWLVHHAVCISCHIGQDFLLEGCRFFVIFTLIMDGSGDILGGPEAFDGQVEGILAPA